MCVVNRRQTHCGLAFASALSGDDPARRGYVSNDKLLRARAEYPFRGLDLSRQLVPACQVTRGSAPSAKAEARASRRSRTRLRSAKIIDSANRFLSECRIHNRSSSGLRLVLARRVVLPDAFCVYEDETGQAYWVAVIWRRGAEIGVRYCFRGAPPPLSASDRFALRERYYEVPDR